VPGERDEDQGAWAVAGDKTDLALSYMVKRYIQHKAIHTHGTLNFYSKRNISSWSARFSTLSYNTPRSYSP
jgi:hypothetical protein